MKLLLKEHELSLSPSFGSVKEAHVLSESKCSQVLERSTVTWALQKVWGFNPQLCRQTDTRCSQWEFCPSKQLGIVHLCTCLSVGLSQVNTRVAVRANLLSELGTPCVPRVTGDTATPGASCSLVLRTPMAPVLQERSDRYLWGYGSLRHSAFGTRRYCSSLEDVLGQIHTPKMPVLTDKAGGSCSPAPSWSWRVCLVFLRLNFYRSRNKLLI